MSTGDKPERSNRFTDEVALITGAASGIGRSVVNRLVAEGARVLAVDINSQALEELASEMAGSVATYAADLANPAQPAAAVAACVERFGRLSVLGNVAGIYATGHSHNLAYDEYRRILDINLDAAVLLSTSAIPHLIEASGSIVTVASHSGLQGVPYALAYSISKGGLIAMTRSLAVEYIKTPMRVNAIAPGAVNTPMASSATFPSDLDMDLLSRLGGFRGAVEPDEVASAFAFLASSEARSVTGAVYTVDYGLTAS